MRRGLGIIVFFLLVSYSILQVSFDMFQNLNVEGAPALFFEDGFESGNFSEWSGTSLSGGVLEVQTVAYDGTYAERAYDTTGSQHAYSYKSFPGQTTIHFRTYILTGSVANLKYHSRFVMGLLGASNTYFLAQLQIGNPSANSEPRYQVLFRDGSSDVSSGWSSNILSADTWYCFEIKVTVGSGTGEVRVYENGAETVTLTDLDNDDQAASVDAVRLGIWDGYGTSPWDIKADCIAVAATYIGPIPPSALTEWSQTYGGTDWDAGESVIETGDGGYAIAGTTESYGAGDRDVWLVKTDSAGTIHWNQTYGGPDFDGGSSLVETGDGGYAIAGYTQSYGGGSHDFWLVKTDAAGNAQWNQTYGGTNTEQGSSVVETSDGGYALTGFTQSYGAGGMDFWLVKTDASGTAQWSRTYGGTDYDWGQSLVETGDGGFAIAGSTSSYGAGGGDVWLVKTDAAGNPQWNQTYGGTDADGGSSLVETGDGGYAIAGYTESYGAGDSDVWLIKTDAAGNAQWNQTYGRTNYDTGQSVVETGDGGYAIIGYTYPSGTGDADVWLIKTDAAGNAQWNQTYGGTENERGQSVVETSDGRYAVAGTTESYGAGSADVWLIKTYPWKNTYLVVRGSNNGIYYRTYYPMTESWISWIGVPGSTPDSPGAAVVGNELHLVVRGMSGDIIWHGYINLTDNSFSGFTKLSGTMPSAPIMTGNSTHLCLVVRGSNSVIYYRFYNVATRMWGGWTAVPGGTTASTPAAVLVDGALHVVVRGSSGDKIWHGFVNVGTGVFSGWTLLSGTTPSPPVLTSNSTHLCLVVRGSNNVVFYRWYDLASEVWGGWTGFPYGSTPDVPAATIVGDSLQVVVRGMTGDKIWHGSLNLASDAWSGWTLLDGTTPSKPVLTS